MDHVVYLDAAAKELALLLGGVKTMLIRGATGRKMPYGRVSAGDRLFFINNNAEGRVKAQARVASVLNSPQMSAEESKRLVDQNQGSLQLTPKQVERWAGKRFLVLVEVDQVQEISPFGIDRSAYGNMDDWLPVGDIDSVKIIG